MYFFFPPAKTQFVFSRRNRMPHGKPHSDPLVCHVRAVVLSSDTRAKSNFLSVYIAYTTCFSVLTALRSIMVANTSIRKSKEDVVRIQDFLRAWKEMIPEVREPKSR